MTGLQSFNKQEPRIKNIGCEEINFEQSLTRSDEDLADILVDLC